MSEAWPLTGHKAAQARFVDAWRGGRMHHAWLIEGPSGVGKSILAKRFAAFALGARGPADAPLNAPASDPVARQILADYHQDLFWLARRQDEKGRTPQDIPVAEVRDLNRFFALKSALGGWRVGVIDALDELNRSGANALLKTLEEPPPKSLILLISHGSRAVLPTIRSRCRTLRVGALSDEETRAAGGDVALDPAARAMIRGRPGLAALLSGGGALAALGAASRFLEALPKPSEQTLIDALRAAGADDEAFHAFSLRALAWLSTEAETWPGAADAYLKLAAETAEGAELALPAPQRAASLIAGLQKAAQAR